MTSGAEAEPSRTERLRGRGVQKNEHVDFQAVLRTSIQTFRSDADIEGCISHCVIVMEILGTWT